MEKKHREKILNTGKTQGILSWLKCGHPGPGSVHIAPVEMDFYHPHPKDEEGTVFSLSVHTRGGVPNLRSR